MIPYFERGFYKALEAAKIRKKEQAVVHLAVEAIKNMSPLNPEDEPKIGSKLLDMMEDESPKVLVQEIALAYGRRKRHWFGVSKT